MFIWTERAERGGDPKHSGRTEKIVSLIRSGQTFRTGGGMVQPDGRFGSPSGDYPSIHVSFHRTTAVAERFMGGRKFTSAGIRTLPRKHLAGMVASVVQTTAELTQLRLVFERDLIALHQSDEWLVTAGKQDYPLTQRWAGWLRQRVETALGIIWQSVADTPSQTAILFGDRCPPG